jgi:hypothetical protein
LHIPASLGIQGVIKNIKGEKGEHIIPFQVNFDCELKKEEQFQIQRQITSSVSNN